MRNVYIDMEDEEYIVYLEGLIKDILRHSVSNLGSKYEFYTCYTYEHGEMPEWVRRAKAIFGTPTLREITWKPNDKMIGED